MVDERHDPNFGALGVFEQTLRCDAASAARSRSTDRTFIPDGPAARRLAALDDAALVQRGASCRSLNQAHVAMTQGVQPRDMQVRRLSEYTFCVYRVANSREVSALDGNTSFYYAIFKMLQISAVPTAAAWPHG